MAYKNIIASKKQKNVAGTSSSLPRPTGYNNDKFSGPEKKERYRELSSRNIWSERTFKVNLEGEFRDCLEIIEDRKWKKLTTPPTNLNYEIFREFYAHVILFKDQPYLFMTTVRGRRISFSTNAINAYLGNPITLQKGELYEYGKRLVRGIWNINMVTHALVFSGESYETNALWAS
ncbi:hypothetical protein RYX36_003709 [Vicia faba]